MKKSRFSFEAIRNANEKLVSRSAKSNLIVSDTSKNGTIEFVASYSGKSYEVSISPETIKELYEKSLMETLA